MGSSRAPSSTHTLTVPLAAGLDRSTTPTQSSVALARSRAVSEPNTNSASYVFTSSRYVSPDWVKPQRCSDLSRIARRRHADGAVNVKAVGLFPPSMSKNGFIPFTFQLTDLLNVTTPAAVDPPPPHPFHPSSVPPPTTVDASVSASRSVPAHSGAERTRPADYFSIRPVPVRRSNTAAAAVAAAPPTYDAPATTTTASASSSLFSPHSRSSSLDSVVSLGSIPFRNDQLSERLNLPPTKRERLSATSHLRENIEIQMGMSKSGFEVDGTRSAGAIVVGGASPVEDVADQGQSQDQTALLGCERVRQETR